MGADAVAGVVVAVCGVLTGLASVMQSRRAGSTAADVQQQVATPAAALTIAPQLYADYSDRLKAAAAQETRLQELLRLALRIVRRQNRALVAAGLDTEPVPDELIPFSIS